MKQRRSQPKITFRERIFRFMYGRNGVDALCKALLVIYFALIVINLFLPRPYSLWGSLLELVLGGYLVFRTLSRNLCKRQRENRWYLRQQNRVKGFFALQKSKRRDRKTHAFRKCKHCKKVLRLPRVKGRHTVRCPLCGQRFEVRI